MSARRKTGSSIKLLLLAVMVLTPLTFLASIPWLQDQPDATVFLLAGIAAAVTIGASFALSVMHDRQLDEWQRTNARFSTQWGWTIGSALIALLLALPPFRDWIVMTVAGIVEVSDPSTKLVILAFTFGFASVILAQGVSTALLSMGWTYWKSRPARDQ